jgi:hypothetical protein
MSEKTKLGQEPAFAAMQINEHSNMQGICSTFNSTQNITLSFAQQISKEAYMIADELLKQENE